MERKNVIFIFRIRKVYVYARLDDVLLRSDKEWRSDNPQQAFNHFSSEILGVYLKVVP